MATYNNLLIDNDYLGNYDLNAMMRLIGFCELKRGNKNNVIAKIKETVVSNKIVLTNMTWLTVLQFANYLIPLLIIPYIVRVLGADLFGKVTYAQNIISYFTLIINYGFDYSATREIAINKHNKNTRDAIFGSVVKQKIVLLVLTFIALLILYLVFDKVHENIELYLFVFFLNIGVVFFPVWFFQGIEDMKTMAIFNIMVRSSGLIFTFFLVRNSTQYLLYPLLISIGYVISGIISFIYVIKHYQINWTGRNKVIDNKLFKNSTPVFLNTLFASFYTTANLTVLGFYYDDYTLGIYGGAQKIIIAIMMLTSTPINMAIFPKISCRFSESIKDGKLILKNMLRLIVLYGTIISVFTYVFSALLVNIILGDEFKVAIPLMRIFSLLPLLVIVASLFTVQGLYGTGLQKYAPYIGASVGIFSILFNLLILPKYGIMGAGWAWVISECLEIILAAGLFYWKSPKLNDIK